MEAIATRSLNHVFTHIWSSVRKKLWTRSNIDERNDDGSFLRFFVPISPGMIMFCVPGVRPGFDIKQVFCDSQD